MFPFYALMKPLLRYFPVVLKLVYNKEREPAPLVNTLIVNRLRIHILDIFQLYNHVVTALIKNRVSS